LFFRIIPIAVLALCSATQGLAGDNFSGSEACKSCHAGEFDNWSGSHHDLAMQQPTEETVLGDFNDATFTYNEITTRFFRRDGRFFVRTDGEDGKLHDFPVEYVFGVYPLQQYLLPLSRGRLQALGVAWDARPAAAGGQRWYHLYPDERVDYRDPLHWTGPYLNWNTRCAECHSTDVRKNYDMPSRSFDTTYAEIDVGCEACHGPGARHIELASSDQLGGAHGSGLPTALAQRGEWAFPVGEKIARRKGQPASRAQVDSCGRCHARRGTLGDYHYGADFLDTHRLALPRAPLYYHDGQIRDEVYVYGSFLQSKMHGAGVVCSNCHEPHSATLRAPGNGVCVQCHRPEAYDLPAHHHHPPGSSGALCANCHMPETTYMGVDPRRDHSMRIPRPDLSVVMGTPNACTQCHSEKDADWALLSLRERGVEFRDTASHPARAFAMVDAGDARAVPTLARLAGDDEAAPIWRASAMEALGQVGGREATATMASLLYHENSIIRTSTVRSLRFLSLPQRLQLLTPLIDDDITSVRLEVAAALAGVPLDQVPAPQADKLRKLFAEYVAIHKRHADMPGALMQLGVFYAERGDTPAAEAAYREALALNPQMVAAYLNLADLLRALDRDDEARTLLLQALAVTAENGNVLHALGLLETRSGDRDKALDYLRRAAELETLGTRHRFVYAIALHDLGQPRMAVAQLARLLRQAPGDEQALSALANYSAELGEYQEAAHYAEQLVERYPGNPNYRNMLQQFQRAAD